MEINKNLKKKIVTFPKKPSICPNCKKKMLVKFTPFCSKKCSDLDLSKWLTDSNDSHLNSE